MDGDGKLVRSGGGGVAAMPWLEWLASGIGLLLTLGMFGSILWQVLDGANEPPIIRVDIQKVVATDGGFRVDFRARNTEGSTAAQVEIEGKIYTSNGDGETSRVVIDYIPGRSAREGGLFFIKDPRSNRPIIRALGYVRP